MSAEKRSEWLPAGWKMVVKTSPTGDNEVCYTCPTSASTFNSKEEVLHYLNHERVDGCTSEPTSCFGDNMRPLAEQVKDFPDWLPPGWALEFKTRQSGKHAGRQYKIYVDTTTGYKFYSKNEVFRYLNDGMSYNPGAKRRRVAKKITENVCSSTTRRKSIKRGAMENVQSQIEHTPDGLPHGWIKEVRYRKTNSRYGVKRDQYYTDPVSGYVFRSRKDAIQYIETGQVSKYAIKPKNRSTHAMYTFKKESHHSPAAKRIKSRGAAVKRCLFLEGTPDANVKGVAEIKELPEQLSLPLLEYPSAQSVDGADSSCMTSSNVKDLGNSKDASINRELNPRCNGLGVSGQTSESEIDNVPEPAVKKSSEPLYCDDASQAFNKTFDELSQRKLDLVRENLSEMQDKKPDEAAHTTPIKPEIMRPLQQENKKPDEAAHTTAIEPEIMRPLQQENKKPDEAADATAIELEIMRPLQQENMSLPALEGKPVEETKLDLKNEEQIKPKNRGRGRPPGRRPGSKKAKALKAITTPLRASKRLAALRAGHGAGSSQANPAATQKNKQKETPIIDLEFLEEPESREHPGEQAVPVKQDYIGELKEEKTGSPLRLPFGDSWPDPCIEFAFKTLTGDIPMLEDTAAIEEYFHKHLSSSKSPAEQGSACGNPKSFSQSKLQPPDN